MLGRPVLVLLLLLLLSLCLAETTLDAHDPVGSPGELAWQAWLLMDEGTDSSSAVRRIKPKSVFIAPSFSPQSLPACAEGYRADAMGRCVKLVRVNQAAQLDFLLQRLNSMYAQTERAPGPPPAGESNGPLQVNLPIEPAVMKKRKEEGPDKIQPSLEEPMEVSVVMADVSKRSSSNTNNNSNNNNNNNSSSSSSSSKEEPKEPVITMWSVENNTLPKREGTMTEDTSPEVVPSAIKEESPTSFNIPLPPPSDVLAPKDVEDSLPMLVISPESSVEIEQTSAMQNATTEIPIIDEEEGSTNEESGENFQSMDESSSVTTATPNLEVDVADNVNKSDDKPFQVVGVQLLTNTSDNEPNIMTNLSVSQNYSDDEPLKLNTSAIQSTSASSSLSVEEESGDQIVEVIQEVSALDPKAEEVPETTEGPDTGDESDDFTTVYSQTVTRSSVTITTEYPHIGVRSPNSGFVRFPSEAGDDPNSFHLFGRNYVKFPSDDSSFNKFKPTSRPHSFEKPTYWWLPPGWRLDRQRHQPTLLRFWSRMPLRSDTPSYHPSYDRSHHSTNQPNFLQDWSSRYREQTRK